MTKENAIVTDVLQCIFNTIILYRAVGVIEPKSVFLNSLCLDYVNKPFFKGYEPKIIDIFVQISIEDEEWDKNLRKQIETVNNILKDAKKTSTVVCAFQKKKKSIKN